MHNVILREFYLIELSNNENDKLLISGPNDPVMRKGGALCHDVIKIKFMRSTPIRN